MVDRPHRPTALMSTPGLPLQPQVSSDGRSVTAVLPTGESVKVLLHGATVVSWKDASGKEKLWLSEAAKLDGTKAVRGGIPLVFPVFATDPSHPEVGKLPQHGLARISRWAFFGKSTSEGPPSAGVALATGSSHIDDNSGHASVKLDFGLDASRVDEKTRKLWGYNFGLQYSVTLSPDGLTTGLLVSNKDSRAFEFQVLFHNYLRIEDITRTSITGLNSASFIDKIDKARTKTEDSEILKITGETDRVYTPTNGAEQVIQLLENDKPALEMARDNLPEVVVWNPWEDKAKDMTDFAPEDGWKKMVCLEAGNVKGWQMLEPGDAFECAQTIVLV